MLLTNPQFSKAENDIILSLHTLLETSKFDMESDFPHVFRKIVATWGTEAFHAYTGTLVMNTPTEDRPDPRQGFPFPIMSEIAKFNKLHDEIYPEFITNKEPMFTC